MVTVAVLQVIRADPWIGVMLLLTAVVLIVVGAILFDLGVSYARKRATRKLIRQWRQSDARHKLRGYPGDRDEDLHGEALIDEIRRRYDGLPVRKR